MFNSISGLITQKLPLALYVETNGIEWEFMVPALSLDLFGTVGSTARVYTWLYHREDQMRLFGFSSPLEREVFIDLMKVEGIGPKQAIKILSSISSAELEAAIDSEDLAKLESAPGIGKKTAQKMILALKGKLARDTGTGKRAPTSGEHDDIVNALAGMGFDRRNAADVVQRVVSALKVENATFSGGAVTGAALEKEIFRRSIVELS